MLPPIEAVTSYIYKYCDSFTSGSRQAKESPATARRSVLSEASPRLQLSVLPSSDPPPYGTFLPPPSYHSAVGGLSLIDRTDNSFKIYHRDLLAVAKEWSRRNKVKGDSLSEVPGGPRLAPRRIVDLEDMFMSIIQHQPCPPVPGKNSCDCRSVRWVLVKEEWISVMYLLGNICQ